MFEKKALISILMFLSITVCSFAQSKPRVAVLPFAGGNNNDGEVLGRLFSTEIANRGVFTILPRTAAVDAAMREMNFQRNGLTDSAGIASIGKGLNADYVIAGYISVLGKTNLLEVTMLGVESLEQIAGSNARYTDIGQGLDLMEEMVDDIVKASTGLHRPSVSTVQNTAVSPLPTQETFSIGSTGPAGGIIFYDKGDHSFGWRYLEAAPQESEVKAAWGAVNRNVGTTGVNIGDGKNNSEIIVAALNSFNEAQKAAQICWDLVIDGYDDWFLPSKEELDLLYKNLHTKKMGGFSSGWYASSSQSNSASVWQQRFSNGKKDGSGGLNGNKINTVYVRAIRAF